jgi:hypothetical protein
VRRFAPSYITGPSQDDQPNRKPGVLEAALLLIVELAASIRQHGLVNPITVNTTTPWLIGKEPDPAISHRLAPPQAVKTVPSWAQVMREVGAEVAPIVTAGAAIYLLESEERRWLAYHLLHRYTGEAQWQSLPAIIYYTRSIWRQAAENTVRADLNAIAKARPLRSCSWIFSSKRRV